MNGRIDLALIGFGNVARAFVRLVDAQRKPLAHERRIDLRVTGIATRSRGAAVHADGIDAIAAAERIEAGGRLDDVGEPVRDAFEVIDRLAQSLSPLRVVVETTTLDVGAGQPAIRHVQSALERGCHVVTANKGPAAFAYRSLSSMAAAKRAQFLFEGAVMDGVPIFNLVRETLPAVRILSFRGIVNSTTNHILTALEQGDEFAPALARMQADGIAEADASLDVDGWDAAAKAAVLANVFLDADITPHDVTREGIGPQTASRARAALVRGLRLRLVASAARGERPSVGLVELPPHDMLSGLCGTANALILDTDVLGRIVISQLDGGLTQTAYALLSDLITIVRREER